jgi:hypothetical protein
MAKSLDARLTRLEAAARQRLYRKIAAEMGVSVEAMLAEAEQFLSQPLEAQLAEVDAIYAEMEAQGVPWLEYENIKATLTREYRP